ncbi:transcription initiation at TATA-containing promoter protein [Entomophthora muscae]|uniref:Transcription initiation at TATA-containing promoter protein n=1 Tax=Entomophthora muscae TaxID=34485 RepID=A0ACC2RDQ1_9FUNG|nr:transcription initiation at TATA-containing promoter protein [Entomophthora muscae]
MLASRTPKLRKKRELEKAIGRLSGTKLNKVVDLICYYMPELGSKEEIEIDLDVLDNKTLSKMYSLVMADRSSKVQNNDKAKHYQA